MIDHRIGTQEEWRAERDKLLTEEKDLTHRNDELTKKRQALPWVRIDKRYEFDTVAGKKSLSELFGGHSQLLVYHFMFGSPYEAGCTVCSSIADTLAPNVPHLAARDTKLMLVSRAPLDRLQAYRRRMGWEIDWASAGATDFNRDMGFTATKEELAPFLAGQIPPVVAQMASASGTDPEGYVTESPGLSAYTLANGVVYRTYAATARGLEPAMAYYFLLDRTAKGRDERSGEAHWIRRHDEY
jgi:predicted dithiol-disulfide oxidoreductase (DUF899 family)